MATVRDMIRKKGHQVFSIAPGATVLEALEMMAKHNVGALLVMTEDQMQGIISERDCVRKVEILGKNVRDTEVNEIMTKDVVTIEVSHPLEECMELMIEKNFRHLPVCEGKELLGIISVRDVLKEVIEVQQMMLSQLERYITGGR